FTDTRRLKLNADKVEYDYHTLRKKYVYPGRSTYTRRIILEVLNMKHVSLAVADLVAELVYLQLKPKMENNKYVEGEFALPAPPKGKHTMENVPTPKPAEKIKVQDEEEECEDIGGLEHRRDPTSQSEAEH
ncbi:hypothetical protein KI387_038147, partial [Taxus chinensis]